MKKKIIGISVCILVLLGTVLPVAGAVNVQTAWFLKENNYFEFYPNTPVIFGRITIKIIGKVIGVVDSDNLLGGAIQVDDEIIGKYMYYSRTQDTYPGDPEIGEYWHTSFPFGIEVNVGGFVFKTDPNNVKFIIHINNKIESHLPDSYDVTSDNNLPLSNGMAIDEIDWTLIDDTNTALSNDTLPTTAPVLTDYTGNCLYIWGHDPSDMSKEYELYIEVTEATKSKSIDVYRAESDWKTLTVIMPYSYNIPFMHFWIKIFEQFPHAFPVIRHILGF